MDFTRCSRLCRRTSFSLETRTLYPKYHRSISTTPSTWQDVDSANPSPSTPSTTTTTTTPTTTTATSSTPSTRPQNAEDEIRTSGPKGSPDYIPFKRGYAPNIPIPSRKFNLPQPRIPAWKKGIPVEPVPTEKPKTIKSIGIEYERKLQAMRRGYIEWRQTTHRERLQKKKEVMERTPTPPKKHFEPTFAEKMTTPSHSEQRKLEKLLFGQLTEKRVRGAGFHLPHHQKQLEKKRYEMITNYLALYAATEEMITTNEQLDKAIDRAFEDAYDSVYRVERPPTYNELVDEVEGGHVGTLRGGYMNRRDQDRKDEVFNTMLGTVGKGKPGFQEVMSVIRERFEADGSEEGETQKKMDNLDGSVAETKEQILAEEEQSSSVAGTMEEILAEEGQSSSVPEVEGEPATADPSQDQFAQSEGSIFDVSEIDQPVDDVDLPAGESLLSTTTPETDSVEPSQTDTIDIVDRKTVSAPTTLHQYPTMEEIEHRKELVRQYYRRGFTNPKDDLIPSPHVFQLDDSSDLAFPSDIQNVLTHESTAPPKHWSIADLAEEDPSVPQAKSRKDILDTARELAKELARPNPFPELNSVDINELESLDYLAQREHFEREFPSGLAKQSPKSDQWAKPTTRKKSTTNGEETVSETTPVQDKNALTEEVTPEDAVTEETPTPVVEKMKSILDEIELDPSERSALEEFRAQRERKRGGERGTPAQE